MKIIGNTEDRVMVYKIEAARFSWLIIEQAYKKLIENLKLLTTEYTHDLALNTITTTWAIIDNSFRFLRLMEQLRGLKHKNIQDALNYVEKIENFRNYIQHLNTEVNKLPEEIYPILGAISWPSNDLLESFAISVGTIPPGTIMNSLAFNVLTKKCQPDIIFNALNYSLNISELFKIINKTNNYLNEWLMENNFLINKDGGGNLFRVKFPTEGVFPNEIKRIKIKLRTYKK